MGQVGCRYCFLWSVPHPICSRHVVWEVGVSGVCSHQSNPHPVQVWNLLQSCDSPTSMSKHSSPAKKLRSSKRLIICLIKKRKSNLSINCFPTTDILPKRNEVSISHQSSLSISPSTKQLTLTKPVLTDVPPDLKKSYQEISSKYENLQNVLMQAEKGFNEIPKLTDDHIQFLKSEIANIPALVLSQLKHLHLP